MDKKVSRRDFIRLAGLSGVAAALAACAPQTVIVKETQLVNVTQVVKETSVVKETAIVKETSLVKETSVVEKIVTPTLAPVKILLQSDGEAAQVAHDAASKDYMAANPHVTIEVLTTPMPSGDKMVAWLAGGTAPDAFRTSLDNGAAYGLKNVIYDFAPYAEPMGMTKAYYESVWKGYEFKNGQHWILPTDTNCFALWTNPVMFEKAGVKAVPTKWSEVEEACALLAKPSDDPATAEYAFGIPTTIGWTSFFMYWWIFREGSEWYDGQKFIFKDALVKALTKLRKMITEKWLPSIDNWQDFWYKGRLAMEEYGQWVIPADQPGPWNDNAPKGKWEASYDRPTFKIAPLFKLEDDIPNYTILAGFGDMCPKTNKNFEETVKYLWFEITDPKHGQMWVTPYNQLPAVSVVTHPWLETDTYKAFTEQIKTSKGFSVYPEIQQCVNNEWPTLILDVLAGKLDAAAACDQMYSIGQPIIQEAQSLR